MKKLFFILFIILNWVNFLFCEREIPFYIQNKVLEVSKKVKPAVVKIYAIIPDFYQGRVVKEEVSGSGTIIHKEGYVITNYHVAGKAKYVRCTLSNGEKIDAFYYAGDPLTDIAIVKIINENHRSFPVAHFGDSSKLKVGEWVIAAGSPFALSQSITLGIISNLSLVIPDFFWPFNKLKLDGENVGSMVKWIGHDAPIYPGNSGGPLLNLDGKIVGVNEISLGLSGAIPGNLARKVASILIQNKGIVRSWIGIEIQPLLETLEVKNGVLIADVIKNSPAEKSGIKEGDIILEINNKKVSVKNIEDIPDFNQMIADLPRNKKIKVVLIRNGKKLTKFVEPVKREKFYLDEKEIKKFGVTARNISSFEAIELGKENTDGVVITSVSPGGPAGEAKPSLRKKDVITEINGEKIKNLSDIFKLTDKISGETSLLISFERKKEKLLTVINIKENIENEIIPQAKKSWLPISIEVLSEKVRKKLGIHKKGVIITSVFTEKNRDFPLRRGDIITEIDGEEIPVNYPEDKDVFFETISEYPVGSEVELTVLRNKKIEKFKVKLKKEPEGPDEAKKYSQVLLEMKVRNLCFDDIKKLRAKKEGVIVEEVKEGGWASVVKIAVGDLIVSVNGEKIKNVNDFKEKVEKLIKDNKNIVFSIERDIHHLFVEIKPFWEEKK